MVGAVAVFGAYLLPMSGKLRRTQAGFLWLNALGAAGIAASLSVDLNAGALLIESAWLAISAYGFVRSGVKRASAR
ncbi:MAG: hypothetical protein L0I62_02435 [Gammaproteobacteria bacterium]|nr:hypothetical protein [Gammaproteobacteria bacterium]